MHERILLKYVCTCLDRVSPLLNGLLVQAPRCLVLSPSFCKAAQETSRPGGPRCVELVTLRAGHCQTFCSCPFFGPRTFKSIHSSVSSLANISADTEVLTNPLPAGTLEGSAWNPGLPSWPPRGGPLVTESFTQGPLLTGRKPRAGGSGFKTQV